MNSKIEQHKVDGSAGDVVKYVLAVIAVLAGMAAFYWFTQWPMPARVLAVIGGLVLGLVVFMSSGKGAQTREFLSESRFELRKVVWPTRQEAIRLTWVVIAVVILISLILAMFDMVIKWALKLFLG